MRMQITSFSCVVKNKGSGEVQEIESVGAWNIHLYHLYIFLD